MFLLKSLYRALNAKVDGWLSFLGENGNKLTVDFGQFIRESAASSKKVCTAKGIFVNPILVREKKFVLFISEINLCLEKS